MKLVVRGNRIMYGPFTWERRADEHPEEEWDLERDPDLKSAVWCVKNYGGKPGPGFAGWKLVSGGPFDGAGAYDSRDAAIVGVTPWLVKYYQREVRKLAAQATKQLAAVRRFQKLVNKAGAA